MNMFDSNPDQADFVYPRIQQKEKGVSEKHGQKINCEDIYVRSTCSRTIFSNDDICDKLSSKEQHVQCFWKLARMGLCQIVSL